MTPRLDVELEAVPGTDDVKVVRMKIKTPRFLRVIHLLDDTRKHRTLAHWTTLMRATILVRVQFVAYAKHPDCPVSHIDHESAALAHIGTRAHHDFRRHFVTLSANGRMV